MANTAFDEFVKRQQTEADPPIDWNEVRNDWLGHLSVLYAQITSFLETYISAGQATFEYREIQLNEEDIGPYLVNQMILKIGRQTITFTPIGTMLWGMKGRVDVAGPSGESRLFLVNKRATGFRSFIKLTASVVGAPLRPAPANEPSEPVEWVWKIGAAPPGTSFIDLTQESFFEMVLVVANG
jgi:hypothetical protein